MRIVVLLVALALAGCAQSHEDFPDRFVQGTVRDGAGAAVSNATVEVLGRATATDGNGSFLLLLGHTGPFPDPAPWNASATGYVPAHGNVTLVVGTVWLDIVLERVPEDSPEPVRREPQTWTESWNGTISCDAVVVVGHDHGGGAPDTNEHTDCDPAQPYPTWTLTVPDNATGLELQVTWDARTPLASHLTTVLHGATEPLAWSEGTSPRVLLVPAAALEPGGTLLLEVSAGAADEDAAAGLAWQQSIKADATWTLEAA